MWGRAGYTMWGGTRPQPPIPSLTGLEASIRGAGQAALLPFTHPAPSPAFERQTQAAPRRLAGAAPPPAAEWQGLPATSVAGARAGVAGAFTCA